MKDNSIETIILRQLEGTASPDELSKLDDWLKEGENYKIYQNWVSTHYSINLKYTNPDLEQIKKESLRRIKKEKSTSSKRRILSRLAVAATVAVLLFSGYLLKQSIESKDHFIAAEEDVLIRVDEFEVPFISNTQSTEPVFSIKGLQVATIDQDTIKYTPKANLNELVFSEVEVPHGKQLDLYLSDGTYVKINSGSILRYPVQFLPDLPRDVYLSGEAYFEVVNKEAQSFNVNTTSSVIEVLGTKFNVSTHSSDIEMEVVLIEGKVNVRPRNQTKVPDKIMSLEPGQKVVVKSESELIKSDVDSRPYLSWITGEIIFKNMELKDILSKLERKYNATIIYEEGELLHQKFTGSFTQKDNIQTILNYISTIYGLDYRIKGNRIWLTENE